CEIGLTDAARQAIEVTGAAASGVPALVTPGAVPVVPESGLISVRSAFSVRSGASGVAAVRVGAGTPRGGSVFSLVGGGLRSAPVGARGGVRALAAEVRVPLLVSAFRSRGPVLLGPPDRGEHVEVLPRQGDRPADRHPGHDRDVIRAVPSAPRARGRAVPAARVVTAGAEAAGALRGPQRAGDADRRLARVLVPRSVAVRACHQAARVGRRGGRVAATR